MTRKKLILVAGTCAMAVAIGSPAFALNPQPLPPGYAAPKIPQVTVRACTGQHIPK
jgi:hypothetical protein